MQQASQRATITRALQSGKISGSALEQRKTWSDRKSPLRLRDIWAIRVRLQIAERTRDLALFDLAIDSKLRACDLTKLRVHDVAHGHRVSSRAMVMQQKTAAASAV